MFREEASFLCKSLTGSLPQVECREKERRMDTGRKAGMMNRQLDEKIFIEVNGIRQGMFLQSENTENPVLLYLHGGPGSPEIAFTQDYPTGLEQLFTVCWWEQRGRRYLLQPEGYKRNHDNRAR